MIRDTAIEEEKESPYYMRHRKIALDYSALTETLNGTVEGMYNAFLVDLNLTLPLSSGTLAVNLFEQLNFVTLDEASQDAMYTSTATFNMALQQPPAFSFQISSPSFWTRTLGSHTPIPGIELPLVTRKKHLNQVLTLLNQGPDWTALQLNTMTQESAKKALKFQLAVIPDATDQWPTLQNWLEK